MNIETQDDLFARIIRKIGAAQKVRTSTETVDVAPDFEPLTSKLSLAEFAALLDRKFGLTDGPRIRDWDGNRIYYKGVLLEGERLRALSRDFHPAERIAFDVRYTDETYSFITLIKISLVYTGF